jgi:NAD(P)-dependent dehydrogenase (short-subunit alcohol dehydrogenase family)
MQPGKRLVGKVAIVTGGASGIGAETARLFAQHGAKVLLTDSNAALGKSVAKEIAGSGGTAMFAAQDVCNEALWATIVAQAEKSYGRLDILCSIAGISGRDPKLNIQTSITAGPRLAEQTLEQWNRVMEINATGVFLGTKAAIPAMQRAGGGSIINTASFVAILGAAAPQIAYTASKGGVLAMTREIAVEFARQNIRCNALCPGPVETPLLAELLSDPARRQRRLVHIPMGRFGRPEEMANAALFLASDESSYVNGATFLVDGGITAAYITPE